MRNLLFVIAIATGLLASPALAQPADLAPIRRFDVETIEQLGRAIYDQDRFAWVGTDALLEEVSRDRLAGMIGWIVVERDGGHVVRFGQGTMDAPRPFYDVTFSGRADPVVARAEGTFNDTESAMFRAVALARTGVTQPCSNRYNSVILPDPDGDGWLVWMFAATTEPDVVMLGGHYRFTVSADGRRIEQADRLSRSCLMMERPPETVDAENVMLTTMHLVSGTPVESQVFVSLSNGIPIMVVTPDRTIWGVMGDDVSIQGVLPDR